MSDLIDYARPMIMAEQAMKKARGFLLDKDYTLALDQLKLAIVEIPAASAATIHIQEQQNALR